MKKQRDDAWYERDTANLTKKILQALLDEARQERDDLQDEIEDLKVTAVKVGQQQALIKTLQKRIENLNQQINYGGRLRHTATTLEDVLKLTGEIKTPEPSFTDLDELEEDDVR